MKTKLEELKAAYAAATAGEWDYVVAESAETPSSFVVDEEGEHILRHRYGVAQKAQRDVAFIALARNLIPTLLEAAELLPALIDYAESATLEGDETPDSVNEAIALLEKLK